MLRKSTWVLGLVAAVALFFVGNFAWAQHEDHGHGDHDRGAHAAEGHEQGQAGMPDPEEMAEMMAKWEEVMKPSEAHEKLQGFVGEWDLEMKSYWGGPGSPPMVSKGTCKSEPILGGRFVVEHVKADMMMPDMQTGQLKKVAFEGIGTNGYDNYRKVYVGTWMDNMGTQLLTYKGSMSPDGKTLTCYGEMDEPMMDVTGRMVKYVTRIESKDKHVLEMYDLHAGEDYLAMQITYTRKK